MLKMFTNEELRKLRPYLEWAAGFEFETQDQFMSSWKKKSDLERQVWFDKASLHPDFD